MRDKQRRHTHSLSIGPWQAEEPREPNVALGKEQRGGQKCWLVGCGLPVLAQPGPDPPRCTLAPGSSSSLAAAAAPVVPR